MAGAIATRLAATYSIEADLSFAYFALEELLERWDEREPPNDIINLALWRASAVAYARCFGPGRRRPQLSIKAVPDEFKETHDQTLALRNWVITHPISEHDQSVAGVEIGPDGTAGATLVMRAIPGFPSREFLGRLKALVDHLGDDRFTDEQRLHAELADQVAKVSPNERLTLPRLGLHIRPGHHGVKRRSERRDVSPAPGRTGRELDGRTE
jgi:hypothetical protein